MKLIPLTFFITAITVFSAAGIAGGGEFSFQPSISVSEEYNDNIALSNENKKEDYITRFLPSISFKYEAPLWKLDASYLYDYRYYAKGNRENETAHNINANGNVEIFKNLLFLNVSDEYKKVSLDVTRDYTKESLFANQSDRNIFTLNPYFIFRASSLTTIKTGYIYADTWYKDPAAVDKTDHTAYVEASHELSQKMTLNGGFRHIKQDSKKNDFDKDEVYIGSKYEYAEGSFLFLNIGNSWIDLKNSDGYSKIFWDAGITHRFTYVTASLLSSVKYEENPEGAPKKRDVYIASFTTELPRTLFNISFTFSEYRNLETKELDTRSYGANGNIKYEITPKLTGNLSGLIEKLERKLLNTNTRRYITGLSLDYEAFKNLAFSLAYSYSDSYSPKTTTENYKNNRLIATISKKF